MARIKPEGNARRPSFGPAIKALQKFKAGPSQLSPAQQETVAEITQRLRRLDNDVGRLIGLNNRFLKRSPLKTEFDPSTDTVTFRVGDVEQKLKLKRANPAVPLTMRRLTAGGAYKLSSIHSRATCTPSGLVQAVQSSGLCASLTASGSMTA